MKKNTGFALIELLVVISIISLLSTVALTSVRSVRLRATNTKKQADFANISQALSVFYTTYGRMPRNYNPCCGACESTTTTYYDQSMQELVDAGLLPAIPRSPDSRKYCYYNYGANTAAGAIMVTTMEGEPNTTTGLPGSCRPFTTNWCGTTNPNNYYCICTTYS